MVSSLIGGVIVVWWFDFFVMKGFVYVFVFGWYFFLSVLMYDVWGVFYGSIVFFNDFLCEILCFFMILFFMWNFLFIVVGLGGVILLDCILFII